MQDKQCALIEFVCVGLRFHVRQITGKKSSDVLSALRPQEVAIRFLLNSTS